MFRPYLFHVHDNDSCPKWLWRGGPNVRTVKTFEFWVLTTIPTEINSETLEPTENCTDSHSIESMLKTGHLNWGVQTSRYTFTVLLRDRKMRTHPLPVRTGKTRLPFRILRNAVGKKHIAFLYGRVCNGHFWIRTFWIDRQGAIAKPPSNARWKQTVCLRSQDGTSNRICALERALPFECLDLMLQIDAHSVVRHNLHSCKSVIARFIKDLPDLAFMQFLLNVRNS